MQTLTTTEAADLFVTVRANVGSKYEEAILAPCRTWLNSRTRRQREVIGFDAADGVSPSRRTPSSRRCASRRSRWMPRSGS